MAAEAEAEAVVAAAELMLVLELVRFVGIFMVSDGGQNVSQPSQYLYPCSSGFCGSVTLDAVHDGVGDAMMVEIRGFGRRDGVSATVPGRHLLCWVVDDPLFRCRYVACRRV